MTLTADVSVRDAIDLACREHLGVWAERKRGLVNAPFHWEWCALAMNERRLAIIAPRDSTKTEIFTVNQFAWRCQYHAGFWAFAFTQSADLAIKLKERIDQAMWATAPELVERPRVMNKTTTVYGNWSRVDVAGTGKSVRGMHPDLIVGDDVLNELNCLTSLQRKRIERWWKGTVGGMAHPGVTRTIGVGEWQRRVDFGPTIVHLVGTPFHAQDLLMSMKDNAIYHFRRYAAEFDPGDLVDGLAVEVAA